MKAKLTQRKLEALVKRQRAFLVLAGANQSWELIEESPWYRYQSELPNPAFLQQADLTGLVLRGLDLPCANMRLVVCRAQDLSSAKLDGGLLREGYFAGSSFRSASLRHVDFTNAQLQECDFQGADLSGAEFENADLSRAQIDWAAAGRGRYRVTRVNGIATGGYGEMEQDFAWIVYDQKRGYKIAQFEGHSYQNFFGSEPIQFSGIVGVRISIDARSMIVTSSDGVIEEHPLPMIKRR